MWQSLKSKMGMLQEPLDTIRCKIISKEEIECNGTLYDLPEEKLTYEDKMFWVYIGIYTGLVMFAGLMSGLTMGLLSLDTTTLMTLKDAGTPTERKHAARILPVVKRHHLLLVTLLLANAGAVEAMPIFLDRVSNPIIAIVISVTAVLIFGEVIPQAICTRYGLAIGAYLSPLVYFLMAAFFVVSFPLAKVLDCCLGVEHGTFYRRSQLKALIDIHGENGHNGEEGTVDHGEETLTKDEVVIIKGALDMKNKKAKDSMVKIEDAFMLSINAKLDHETMTLILQRGHSRIPVYGGNHSNVLALLLTKTLIKLDPDDAVPVQSVMSDLRYAREVLYVDAEKPLFDLLNLFQTGRSHLAIVRKRFPSEAADKPVSDSESAPLLINIVDCDGAVVDDSAGEEVVVGLITLEDVIEELLQEEIEDETDFDPDMTARLQLSLVKSSKKSTNPFHRCRSQPNQVNSSQAIGGTPQRQVSRSLENNQGQDFMAQATGSPASDSDQDTAEGKPRVRFT